MHNFIKYNQNFTICSLLEVESLSQMFHPFSTAFLMAVKSLWPACTIFVFNICEITFIVFQIRITNICLRAKRILDIYTQSSETKRTPPFLNGKYSTGNEKSSI